MIRVLIFIALSVASADAQTWYTGDPTGKTQSAIESGILVTRAPIKVLEPPQIARIKISWDRIVGHWAINLESAVILDPIYKPCSFLCGDFNGYTVRAGDRDCRTFLVLATKSYEQAIMLRDALIGLHHIPAENVATEDKAAEKRRD